MFKPLRFNNLFRAIPGLAHLQLTPQSAHHAQQPTAQVHQQVETEKLHATNLGVKRIRVKEDIEEDVHVKTGKESKTTEVHKRVTAEIRVKRVERKGTVPPGQVTLEHVHATTVEVAQIEMTPPHPPREQTPMYMRTHHHLVYTLDTPCAICGVRNTTLQDPRENPCCARAIETHHYPIERSLLNACDPCKVHLSFPQVKDHASLEAFVDLEANIMVLCDIHHRHPHHGIHHILAQDFFIQPFLFSGYEIVADTQNVEKVMIANERVIKGHTAM